MEIRSATVAFVALYLFYYAGRCSSVVQIIMPEPGSVVEHFVGDENISFFCEVLLNNGSEQATTWSIQQQNDNNPRAISVPNELNIVLSGDPIPNAPAGFFFNTNLTILVLTAELHLSTLFCGTAENLEAANFTILALEEPSRPLALALNRSDEDSTVLTWQPPDTIGSPPINIYNVVLSPVDNQQALTVSINISVPTTTVEIDAPDLFPMTTYMATVTGISTRFISPPSSPITFTTNISVPRLDCTSEPTPQDTMLVLSPTVVHSGGLPLAVHMVGFRLMESENFTSVTVDAIPTIINGQITDIELTNDFNAGSTYIFQVSSSNALGFSNLVECPPFNLTIGIPTVPSTPTGSSTAPDNVELMLSTEEAGVPSPPHSFRFNVRVHQLFPNDSSEIAVLIGNFTQPYPQYTDGSSVILTVNSLMAEEEFVNGSIVMYAADAQAINNLGASDFSSLSGPITVELTAPLLNEVQTRVTSTGTQLIVEWTYVHTGGVAVTAVLVEFRNGSSQAFEVAPGGNLTDPSQDMLSIPGEEFLAGLEYQFRVTATNLIGSSDETDSEVFEAIIGIPATPEVPTIRSSTGRAVLELQTLASGLRNVPHTFRFVVRIYQLSNNDSFTADMGFPQYMSGERVSFPVDNLVVGERYQFAAQAYNQFGTSEFSDRSDIITITEALCPDPPAIENGMVTATGNSVGDTATYTCNSDFELIGSATATCGPVNISSAVFSPAPPECRPIGDDGLSTGAWVGIAIAIFVGVVLLIVIVVLVIVFCVKRSRVQQKEKTEYSEELGLQYNEAYGKEKTPEETAFNATDQPGPETTNTYEAIAEKDPQERQETKQQQNAPNLYDSLAAIQEQTALDPDIDDPDPPSAKTSANPLYSGLGADLEGTNAAAASNGQEAP